MGVFTLILSLKAMLVEHVRLYGEGADFSISRAAAPCVRRQADLLTGRRKFQKFSVTRRRQKGILLRWV
jgi:hypothetical protein